MNRDKTAETHPQGSPLFNPWVLAGAGVAATGLALLLSAVPGTALVPLRVTLIVAGITTAGGAAWLRLHFARADDGGDRAQCATLVALAALAPIISFAALDEAWDSARLLVGVIAAVAVAGAVVVLLPPLFRRVAISLLVLVHFGGILTAVTSVPPPGADGPWVTGQAWGRLYRHYLLFMYINNAYHFYSPEPGPPTLLWFYVEYDGAPGRWVELPKREQFATRQEYQRRLAMTESTNQLMPLASIPDSVWHDLLQKRVAAAQRDAIPLHPNLPESWQFRAPNTWSKLMLSAYARHVAHAYPSEDNPSAKVVGVKVYKVVHAMLNEAQMAEGFSPIDPTFYQPFYMGEFDPEGNLRDATDPYLYWMIPIIRVPKEGVQDGPHAFMTQRRFNPDNYEIKDFTRVHAPMDIHKVGR